MDSRRSSQFERRWPVALSILAVMGLILILPERLRLVPLWVPHLIGITILLTMAIVPLTGATLRGRRVERLITFLFCLTVGGGTLVNLALLIVEMISGAKAIDGIYLLASSIAVWLTNVLVFALVYWQIDRGGPEARLGSSDRRPDWLFTEPPVLDDSASPWRPIFVDYLFLAFTTATAFSPTDTLPLTPRAKLLMMAESSIALVTVAAVASRAINILGS